MKIEKIETRKVGGGSPQSRKLILLLLLVLLNLVLVAPPNLVRAASPPFDVRRASDPAAVRTAAVHVTVSSGPFDDDPGTLSDGANYYYVIEDAMGEPAPLSAHPNPGQDTIRLGFDDGDPASAPVDPDRSTVEVAPDTIPANGLARATVTIVPRDANGVPLGAGLSVRVDPSRLWPGVPATAVDDRGDGSYALSVVSSVPGQATALVRSEGLLLAAGPTITYEPTAPPVCGNASCEPGEHCLTCPADCGSCPPGCGNGVCNPRENCGSCPADCGACPPLCGNGVCDVGLESCGSCPLDCGDCAPGCGNGVCSDSESCGGCPDDCGHCS